MGLPVIMGIFENVKKNTSRTIKVLGFPVYTDVKSQNLREQTFLNGLMKSQRLKCVYSGYVEKKFELFGCPLIKVFCDEHYKRYYIGGKLVKTIDLKKRFERRYFTPIEKYDDIYVLNSRSGETYLFLAHIAENFIKRNGSKKPLLVATAKYHIDLVQMLLPEIPCIYSEKMHRNISCDVMAIADKRVFLLFPCKYFWSIEENIRTKPIGESHYFADMLNHLGMTSRELSNKKLVISNAVLDSMLTKVKVTELNLDNFVFIAPHAQSCEEYDTEFWAKLCERLKEREIDAYFNVSESDKHPIMDSKYKTCDLTFGEAFAFARMSRLIVSLRSGMSELLMQTGVPQHVICTKFRERGYPLDDASSERIMAGFSLKAIPNVNHENITEYDADKVSCDVILESIINTLQEHQESALAHTTQAWCDKVA